MNGGAQGSLEGVYLVCDLDGTLLGPDSTLHPDNLAALTWFRLQGGRFSVATGRSPHSVLASLPELPVDQPGIYCNGSMIVEQQDGTLVRGLPLPEGTVDAVRTVLDRIPGLAVQAFSADGMHRIVDNDEMRRHFAPEKARPIPGGFDRLPAILYKILLSGPESDLLAARSLLENAMPGRLAVTRSSDTLLDVMRAGTDKGEAARFLKAKLDAIRPIVLFTAAGDHENDLGLLQEADFAFAMGQAPDIVKQAADVVLPDHSTPCLPAVIGQIRRILEVSSMPYRTPTESEKILES